MLSHVPKTLNAVRIRYPSSTRIAYLVYRTIPKLFVRNIKLGKILFGGDFHSGLIYARISGDLLTPSTPVAASPHAQFLRTYREIGDAIFQPDQFAATSYCKYALKCIELNGKFFSHVDFEGVLRRAKSFALMLDGALSPEYDSYRSRPGWPVEVRRIKFSDYYEVYDGLHRLSVAAVRGLDEYPCAILPVEGTLTAMQMMAMDTVWWGAPHRLFQPVPFPELEGWSVARQCTDRIDLIMGWLRQNSISFGSFLDIGSSYGWFVSEMAKRGFQASGVEQDAAIAAVGPVAYGLDALAVTVANLGNFLRSAGQKYDVVCCLSILHNYLLGSQKMSATEFIRLIDQITGSVLFFDTAECHESRFKHSLSGWNADYIRSWLREHTSFSKIELLGTDSDGYGVFRKQYGRHLFACSRQL